MAERSGALRAAGWLLGAGVWFFVALAVWSFNPLDWPSHAVYPHQATSNIGGGVGAWIAYQLVAAVGQGVWPLLVATGVLCVLRFAGVAVNQLWLRLIGLVVLVATTAAIFAHLGTRFYGLPEGDGGVVGVGIAHHLGVHFAVAGTRLILLLAVAVGLLVVADEIFFHWPARLLGFAQKARENISAASAGREPVVVNVPTLPKPTLPRLSLPSFPRLKFNFTKPEEAKPKKLVFVNESRKRAKDIEDDGPAPDAPEIDPDVSDEIAMEDAVAQDEDLADEAELEEELEEQAETDVEEEAPEAGQKRDLSKIKVRLARSQTPKQTAPPPQELGEYELPDWESLAEPETGFAEQQEEYVRDKAAQLEEAFEEFGVDAQVEAIDTGPVITMYEIGVAKGTKVAQITGLSNDLARTLAAESVRIVAPIPGKNTIGIEVPNAEKEKVRLKDLMQQAPAKTQKMHIPIFLGKDSSGAPLIDDLTRMPHCLIAGTTGSGKSVCINSIILSIMYTQRPDRVKLILVDPKVVEMAPFKDIPHLMCPVITDAGKATSVLEWACTKMDERYELLAEAGVRNIAGYNSLEPDELLERMAPETPEEEAKIPKKLPYVVVIIDELADLMMTGGKDVEASIVRIAQKARAVGIHLILATQRPQANVVTGLIKSNMPAKIAFRVASKMDSRIVLDQNGADLLLGQGDMLFLPPGASKPRRSQGTFIDDTEIRSSVRKVKELADAQFEPELVQMKGGVSVDGDEERDPLYDDAVRVVLESRRGSVSLLQRKLTIGYARASRIIEAMEADGLVGGHKGGQAREATLTLEEWEELRAQNAADDGFEDDEDALDYDAEVDPDELAGDHTEVDDEPAPPRSEAA
jgi:S-DNA-T family DNA segregation ATPase FtsK/SpoIIIE